MTSETRTEHCATASGAVPRTLFDKLWDAHVVANLGDGAALLHVDRHLVHDLGGGPAFALPPPITWCRRHRIEPALITNGPRS